MITMFGFHCRNGLVSSFYLGYWAGSLSCPELNVPRDFVCPWNVTKWSVTQAIYSHRHNENMFEFYLPMRSRCCMSDFQLNETRPPQNGQIKLESAAFSRLCKTFISQAWIMWLLLLRYDDRITIWFIMAPIHPCQKLFWHQIHRKSSA